LLYLDRKLRAPAVKEPAVARQPLAVQAGDHENGKRSLEIHIHHDMPHGGDIRVARNDLEVWVAVPLTDVVEAPVLVLRSIEETQCVSRGLHQIDDEPSKRPPSPLERELGGAEVRRRKLLTVDLAADLLRSSTAECIAQNDQLITLEP
jgi:hypothetical protein